MSRDNSTNLVLEEVWHPLTRVWHWALAVSVIAGWLLGEFRTFSVMQWHFYCGYATGSLLLFRIYWGLYGPENARFRSLMFSISEYRHYISTLGNRRPSGVAGHNPLGALSVVLLLSALLVQVLSGLFSEDDSLFFEGPLADYLSTKGVLQATSIHHQFSSIILILVGTHLAAIIFYFAWKKENLVSAMITGWKWVRKSVK